MWQKVNLSLQDMIQALLLIDKAATSCLSTMNTAHQEGHLVLCKPINCKKFRLII